jgi:hypothetical protein
MVEVIDGVAEGTRIASPAKPGWRDGMHVRVLKGTVP